MNIITINLPEAHLKTMSNVQGEDYENNRSVQIRKALDSFLDVEEHFREFLTDSDEKMRIITVNITNEQLNRITKLVKARNSFPSRSELVRVAVREYLIELLYREPIKKEDVPPNIVRIPTTRFGKESGREFEEYKIVRRLDNY